MTYAGNHVSDRRSLLYVVQIYLPLKYANHALYVTDLALFDCTEIKKLLIIASLLNTLKYIILAYFKIIP